MSLKNYFLSFLLFVLMLFGKGQILYAQTTALFSAEQYESMIQDVRNSCARVSDTIYVQLVDMKSASAYFSQETRYLLIYRDPLASYYAALRLRLEHVYPVSNPDHPDAVCFLSQAKNINAILLKRVESSSLENWQVDEIAHLIVSLYYEAYYARQEFEKQQALAKAELMIAQTFMNNKNSELKKLYDLALANLFVDVYKIAPYEYRDEWKKKTDVLLAKMSKTICAKEPEIIGQPSHEKRLALYLFDYACHNEWYKRGVRTVFERSEMMMSATATTDAVRKAVEATKEAAKFAERQE